MFDVILLETANSCNRSCWYCLFSVDGHAAEKLMPWELIEKVGDELEALNYEGRISPFGINEPLLDPRLDDILRLFRAKCGKAYLGLTSNGDLITPERLEQLWGAGLDSLHLSCHDQASAAQAQRLKDQSEHGDRITLGSVGPPSNLDNRYNRGQGLPLTSHCRRPENMLVIRCNGKVALCCADMKAEIEMGDINHQSLLQIWRGERFEHYRKELREGRRGELPLCGQCSHNGSSSRIK